MAAFSKEFRDTLSRINGSHNTSAILKALKLLQHKSMSANDEDAATINAALAEYDMLHQQLSDMSDELKYFGQAIDADLEQILFNLIGGINDFASAHEAVNFYDLAWFRSTAKSIEAKIRIAAALGNQVTKFGFVPTTLWTLITKSDSATLSDIQYTGNYMNQDTTSG